MFNAMTLYLLITVFTLFLVKEMDKKEQIIFTKKQTKVVIGFVFVTILLVSFASYADPPPEPPLEETSVEIEIMPTETIDEYNEIYVVYFIFALVAIFFTIDIVIRMLSISFSLINTRKLPFSGQKDNLSVQRRLRL